MSYSDFVKMTPAEIVAVSHGYQKRVDMEAWLTGRYVHEALSAVLSAALGKKGRTPYRYPSQPYSATEAPQEAADDEGGEELGTKINFMHLENFMLR